MAKYMIWNGTDGITADPMTYPSKKAAQDRIDAIRKIFKNGQGYYRNNRMEKIAPEDIDYQILPAGKYPLT